MSPRMTRCLEGTLPKNEPHVETQALQKWNPSAVDPQPPGRYSRELDSGWGCPAAPSISWGSEEQVCEEGVPSGEGQTRENEFCPSQTDPGNIQLETQVCKALRMNSPEAVPPSLPLCLSTRADQTLRGTPDLLWALRRGAWTSLARVTPRHVTSGDASTRCRVRVCSLVPC